MPRRKTNKEFIEQIYSLVKDEYIFLEEYNGSQAKIKVIHNKCKREYLVTPNRFLQGDRCPFCSKSSKKTNDAFLKEVFNLVGNEFTFLEEYKTSKTAIKVRHNICKNEF